MEQCRCPKGARCVQKMAPVIKRRTPARRPLPGGVSELGVVASGTGKGIPTDPVTGMGELNRGELNRGELNQSELNRARSTAAKSTGKNGELNRGEVNWANSTGSFELIRNELKVEDPIMRLFTMKVPKNPNTTH